MSREHRHAFRQSRVVRHDRARIAHGAEILTRVEGKRRYAAESPDSSPLVLREVSLRTVLEHPKSVLARKREYWIHIGRLAIQMNRNDADSTRSDLLRNVLSADRIRLFIRVAEHYRATSLRHRRTGRYPGVRGYNHFITRLNSQRAHRDVEGIRSIGT